MDDKILAQAFLENVFSLLTVEYPFASIHPEIMRNVNMPPSGSWFSAVDALEKLQDVTFGNSLWPPFQWMDIYLVTALLA